MNTPNNSVKEQWIAFIHQLQDDICNAWK